MIKFQYILSQHKKRIVLDNDEVLDIEDKESELQDSEVYEYLQYIEQQKRDNKHIYDFYLYDNISIYHCSLFRNIVFTRLKHLLYCIELLQKNLGKYEVDLLQTDSELMYLVANQLMGLHAIKIDVEKSSKSQEINQELAEKKNRRMEKGQKSLKKFLENKASQYNVLFFSAPVYFNYIKDKQGNTVCYDTQLAKVLDFYRSNTNVMYLEMYQENNINKSLDYRESSIPFEYYTDYIESYLSKIEIDNSLLVDNTNNIDSLDYDFKGFNLKYIMINYVFKDMKDRLNKNVKEILSAEIFLREHNIDFCIMTNEVSCLRNLVVAGNRLNTPSYGIQHGAIVKNHLNYLINSDYSKILAPKKTFVWGRKTKELLIAESNLYNEENIEIVGQLRTDLIYEKIREPQGFRNKLRILYATQYFEDINKPAAKLIINALSRLNRNYELIIKMHPADTYKAFYEKLIKNYDITEVSIIQHGDLYEYIQWCDVLVNVYSTVTMEAVLFNKPSICVNVPNYIDKAGFIKEGLAKGADTEEGLIKLLEAVDIAAGTINQSKYLEDNFYKIDGKVYKRILDCIHNQQF